jgi:hypothetical protein
MLEYLVKRALNFSYKNLTFMIIYLKMSNQVQRSSIKFGWNKKRFHFEMTFGVGGPLGFELGILQGEICLEFCL